ncbi:MAG TPA: hypothetical protein VF855_14625 [Acidimicrobiales bacterium]
MTLDLHDHPVTPAERGVVLPSRREAFRQSVVERIDEVEQRVAELEAEVARLSALIRLTPEDWSGDQPS